MNRSVESVLRFVNVTASGFLAGSLGFGGSNRTEVLPVPAAEGSDRYLTAIGPVALATSVTLAIGANRQPLKRTFDVLSTLSLAGVVAATVLGTASLDRKTAQAASDYASDESAARQRNWSRAQTVRAALGISAFFLSVASNVTATPPAR